VDDTSESGFKLSFLLVVHGDADGHGWLSLSYETSRSHLCQQCVLLNLPRSSIRSEGVYFDSRVEGAFVEHEGLIFGFRSVLVGDLLETCIIDRCLVEVSSLSSALGIRRHRSVTVTLTRTAARV
jgi:hypothetical protein